MATVDKQYLYSVGRVKELEKGLLVQTNLDRVLESDEPLSVLRSIGFFKATDDHERQKSVDDIFRREREYNRRQLHELVADSPLEEIFLLPYDLETIKLYVKGKLVSNPSVKDIPVEEGMFRKAELQEAIFDELPTRVPAVILDEISSIAEAFHAQRRFSLIDSRLNRALRHMQLTIARQAGNRFLIDYLQQLSDVQNIATLIRYKVRKGEREDLASALLDTGTLPLSFFERIYDSGWESMVTAFKPTAYGKMVTKVLADVEEAVLLPVLDVACAQTMIDFLRSAKRISFGIEPILAYYLARDNELSAVRAILAGKKFDYAQEKLLIRMRELYS